MFKTLLIANRGEIACRIMATAKAMGMRTIGVYSDADASARHVRLADVAIRLGPAAAQDSYLRGDLILKAALDHGAEAIHPGYGFLSENAAFAEACAQAGIAFVGPDASAIRDMGLKDRAKAIAVSVGAPVLPGYWEADQSADTLRREAERIGFPLLVKAVAGGGGRGIRAVDTLEDFEAALASAKREAAASFGDDRVMLEKLVLRPRHIEVQVFGDQHGNLVHLFERDCSIQRRRQKLIEEVPAPGISDEVRDSLTEAALKIARAVNYSNAGTVEFVADGTGPLRPDGFWFLEMNTRLQVEHPVTEMVTGLDLVSWQLRVAAGEPLPLSQSDIRLTGAAIEARIVAEDPAQGFLPSSGQLRGLKAETPGVRIDSGFDIGDHFPDAYDSLVEKVIVHGPDRGSALAQLRRHLRASALTGITTNTGYLARLCEVEAFKAGRLHTGLLDDEAAALAKPLAEAPRRAGLAAIAIQIVRELNQPQAPGPFGQTDGWRLNGAPRLSVHFGLESGPLSVALTRDDMQLSAAVGGDHAVVPRAWVSAFGSAQSGWTLLFGHGTGGEDDVAATAFVTEDGVALAEDGEVWQYDLQRADAALDALEAADEIKAPLPGKIAALTAVAGDEVKKGQVLIVLEAMKMEHALAATRDGRVAEVRVSENRHVKAGDVLVTLEAVEPQL